jgi:hypothetical protein
MKHVSATQVGAFNDCARKWYLRYVTGIKMPQTPPQILGSSIHKSLEYYMTMGEILDDEFKEYVEAAIPFLPPPAQAGHLLEHKFLLPTFEGGPLWMGVIDLGVDEEPPVVCDYKTTSDFRYVKTPAEMESDTQLCSYAKWVQTEQQRANGYMTGVIVQLLYLHTRRKTKEKRVMQVETVLTPEQVNAIWMRDLAVVRRMVVAEQLKNVEELSPTIASCSKYGGCPYRTQCGLEIVTNPGRKKKNDMSSFLDRMKAKQGEQTSGGNNDPTVLPIEGVIPGDGAPRTTPVLTEEEKAAAAVEVEVEKKSRGRPKLTEAQKEANKKKRAAERLLAKAAAAQAEADAAEEAATAPPPPPAAEPPPAQSPAQALKAAMAAKNAAAPTTEQTVDAPPAAVQVTRETVVGTCADTREGFTLYIDCWPVKGNGVSAVLFDDWIVSVIKDINDEIDVTDYRLLSFTQEKLALQAGLEKHLGSVPHVLVLSTTSSVAKDAMQTLIPHAAQVIRAMR